MASILPVSDLRNYNEVLRTAIKASLYILPRMVEDVLWLWILKIMNVIVRKRSF